MIRAANRLSSALRSVETSKMATASAAVARAPARTKITDLKRAPKQTPPGEPFSVPEKPDLCPPGRTPSGSCTRTQGTGLGCKASLRKIGEAVLTLSAWLQFD